MICGESCTSTGRPVVSATAAKCRTSWVVEVARAGGSTMRPAAPREAARAARSTATRVVPVDAHDERASSSQEGGDALDTFVPFRLGERPRLRSQAEHDEAVDPTREHASRQRLELLPEDRLCSVRPEGYVQDGADAREVRLGLLHRRATLAAGLRPSWWTALHVPGRHFDRTLRADAAEPPAGRPPVRLARASNAARMLVRRAEGGSRCRVDWLAASPS